MGASRSASRSNFEFSPGSLPQNNRPDGSLSLFQPSPTGSNTSPQQGLHLQHLHLEDPSDGSTTIDEVSSNYTLAPTHQSSMYADLHNSTPSPSARAKLVPKSPRREVRSLFVASASTRTPDKLSVVNNQDIGSVSSALPGTEIPRMPESRTENSENEDESNMPQLDEDTYSVRQESLPPAPVYNLGLQNGLGAVKKALAGLANTMCLSELVNDSTTSFYKLQEEIRQLSDFKYPETRTVGFIGDSGAGKSSVINSLLDQPNLARSSRDGAACTCVVTEFRNIDDAHPRPFTVEADFMSPEERTELLQELLRSFRHFFCPSEFQQITSSADRESLRQAATRAQETLEYLFQNQPEYSHEAFCSEEDGAYDALLGQLEQWSSAELSRKPDGLHTFKYTVTADDLLSCKDQLNFLTANSHDNGQPVLWPFIKLITVYLDSVILRTGLVVADMPGFGDLNYARVRATEKYLLHNCSEVFIVTDIARCCSDQSIDDIQTRCEGKTQHIDVSPEESAENRDGDARRVREMNEEIKKVTDQLGKARKNVRIASADRKRDFAMEQHRLTNTLYSEHRDDSQGQAEAYIRLSGIRGLRRHCQLVPAEAQMRAVSAYIKDQVPALLGSLRQWTLAGADSVTAERAAILRRVLEEAEKGLRRDLVSRQSHIAQTQTGLTRLFRVSILELIQNSQNEWTDQCVEVSQRWASWHHTTYAAFCRKNGTHSTKGAGGYHCWNDELVEHARDQLSPRWDSIRTWLVSQNDALETAIAGSFESLRILFQRNELYAPHSIGNLLASMEPRQRFIVHQIQNSINQVIHNTDIITRDMLQGHDSSFMATLMRPAYVSCASEGGSGSDSRRKEIIRNHLMHSRIFADYHNRTRAEYSENIQGLFDVLQEKITEQVNNIARDFQAMIAGEGEVPEAEQAPAMAAQLKSNVESAEEILKKAQVVLQQVSHRH
ncbi:hypothetical protein N7510_007189 [Penicillium lagena]|uniref:uncharacterized protein n=1 Tax=Penicillium lagena TaxID=94218 RepID=UPI0025405583|nr:uncharacterized protein N7510_007189 [Penicillium lagena]KAJ5610470.1 hypothetical protein N7510_007189 [Penicillium lagena]